MTKSKTISLTVIALLWVSCVFAKVDSTDDSYLDLMTYNFNTGDYSKAIDFAEKLISDDASNPLAWTTKGRALYRLDLVEQSIEVLDSAISQFPDYAPALLYKVGILYDDEMWDVDQVVSALDTFLMRYPNNVEVRKTKAQYMSADGKYANTLNELNTILVLEPMDYEVLLQRAYVKKLLGQNESALLDLNKILADTDSTKTKVAKTALKDRARLYILDEKYPQAINDLSALLSVIPDSSDYNDEISAALNMRGYAYMMFGENLLALEDFDQAVDLAPEDLNTLTNRILVYLELKEYQKACQDINNALDLGYETTDGVDLIQIQLEHCQDEKSSISD